MAARRTLFISNTRLTVHCQDGSRWFDSFSFDADEEGLARFALYIERFPNDVTSIIVDVVEEEFREETIPHVFGKDRRALLRGKATRLFRDARYVHSAMQGREPGGRRDDRVLFSAITRPDILAPWLAPIARCAVPLVGICSPAVLTGAMLKAIMPAGAAGGHVLIVSLQRAGGLRQTYFQRGRLRLSRLAVMPDPAADRYGVHALAEIERTRRYLNSLRMVEDGNRLDICVLSHGETLDALRRELGSESGNESGIAHTFVDLADAARRLGMRRWGGEPAADRLFVHVLAGRAGLNHYATPEEIRGFAMLRARSLLKAASVLLAVGGIAAGGAAVLEGVIAGGHTRALAQQATLYENRYQRARAQLPPAPVEPAELARVVSVVNALRARRGDPVDLLALIGEVLAVFPRVRVESVSWRMSDGAPAAAGDDRAGARPAGEAPRRDPGAVFQIAIVSARIEPFDGDYRAAIDTIHRLVGALAAPPGVEHAQVLSLPLDLSPQRALSGDVETIAETAVFEIRVTLRAAVLDGAEI